MPDQVEDNKEELKTDRRRMVVEELGGDEPDATSNGNGELKEKVEELQEITEHIAEDVKESAEVQEEIAKEVEKQEDFIPPKQAPDFNPLVVIIPGILLLGALVGGIVFYQNSMNKVATQPTPTAKPEEVVVSETPTPTPSEKADLTKYEIVVQNGSGIAGEAGRAQTAIEKEGFKVSGTTNADAYTYTKTVVKAKATVDKDYLKALTDTLGKSYTVDTKVVTLSASSTDDVQVIVGSLKADK